MPTAEVAACLGITEEAVRVRLHRARLGIRDSLLAQVRTSAREAFPFLGPRCSRLVEAVLGRILGAGGSHPTTWRVRKAPDRRLYHEPYFTECSPHPGRGPPDPRPDSFAARAAKTQRRRGYTP